MAKYRYVIKVAPIPPVPGLCDIYILPSFTSLKSARKYMEEYIMSKTEHQHWNYRIRRLKA